MNFARVLAVNLADEIAEASHAPCLGAIGNYALPYRLAVRMEMVALIMSMPRGGLSFSYRPLDSPGRTVHIAHRSRRTIVRKEGRLTDEK